MSKDWSEDSQTDALYLRSRRDRSDAQQRHRTRQIRVTIVKRRVGPIDDRHSVGTAWQVNEHVQWMKVSMTYREIIRVHRLFFQCDAHSFEHYDRETGISVYMAPSVKQGQYFLYFDPLHQLSKAVQRRWADPAERDLMTAAAIAKAKERVR